MPRKAKQLTAIALSKLTARGFYFVGGVDGLALSVSSTGARNWILRVRIAGKRCDVGLGAFPEVSLATAREKAIFSRQQIRDGINPIAAKREAKAALMAAQASFITFEDAAAQYIAAHERSWKNIKHASQWRNTLSQYAYPTIGKLHVKDVGLEHVMKVLEPIWASKTETATRLRGRMESVLDWARVRGFRSGDNPARWKGNLDTLLPARSKIARVKHHEAMPWHDAPGFWQELGKVEGVGAQAMAFLILTAARSGEVREATWDEIDLERKVWTIPAERMKKGREQRVPLTPAAMTILEQAPTYGQRQGLIFTYGKKPLSDNTLTIQLKRMGKTFKVHGFRSTFRDWAGETTAFPREVIEHALAHQLKDKAEAAYARGDLFTKRTKLMEAWAGFVTTPKVGENVTALKVSRG